MTDAAAFVKRASGIYDAIAADLAPAGGILRCQESTCRTEQPLGDIAEYTRHGWPKHCGRSMLWVTQKELDEERSGA